MKISIPENTKDCLTDLKNEGDLSEISRMIYGDNSRRRLVQVAMQNGYGNEKVVRAIVKYYNRKQKLVKQLS